MVLMLRMLMVVMVTMLSLGGAKMSSCGSCGCKKTNHNISVESCGFTKNIETTVCEGQCYNVDNPYQSTSEWVEYQSCNGDWSYEVTFIDGCGLGVTYPVALSCGCKLCNRVDTVCGTLPEEEKPSCLPRKITV